MRTLFVFALIVLSGCAQAEKVLNIFDSKLALGENCELISNVNGQIRTYNIDFKTIGKCRIVTHPNTSAENIVFINGGYIIFIENNHDNLPVCNSEFTAVKVDKNSTIEISPIIKRSGSCFQGRELKDFKYFSGKFRS